MPEPTEHGQTVAAKFWVSFRCPYRHVQVTPSSVQYIAHYLRDVHIPSRSLFDQRVTSGWGHEFLGVYNASDFKSKF